MTYGTPINSIGTRYHHSPSKETPLTIKMRTSYEYRTTFFRDMRSLRLKDNYLQIALCGNYRDSKGKEAEWVIAGEIKKKKNHANSLNRRNVSPMISSWKNLRHTHTHTLMLQRLGWKIIRSSQEKEPGLQWRLSIKWWRSRADHKRARCARRNEKSQSQQLSLVTPSLWRFAHINICYCRCVEQTTVQQGAQMRDT